MATTHAILSPSSAHRWLACTPSARFEEQIPEEESKYAAEGTLAHELAAIMLMRSAGIFSSETSYQTRLRAVESDPLYTPEMHTHCADYAAFVKVQGGDILVERGYDLDGIVPLSFGTADATNLHPTVIYITDFKYGAGVRVTATANPQMMLYALGAIKAASAKGYNIERAVLSIYQPRVGGVASWEISVAGLKTWAEKEVWPKALLAIAGQGEFVAGNHCHFCKARTCCRAFYERFASVKRIADAREITPMQRREVLRDGPALGKWIEAMQADAVKRLLNSESVEGFKLVAGNGKRAFTSEDDVVDTLVGLGFKREQIFNVSLKSLTDIEKVLGKKQFKECLDGNVQKKAGNPTLAPDDDPREEYKASDADEYSDADLNELL